MTRRTLVPMDGSAHSQRGLEHALSEHEETDVVVLHVVDPLESSTIAELSDWQLWCDRATETANAVFADAQAIADGYNGGISTTTVAGRGRRSSSTSLTTRSTTSSWAVVAARTTPRSRSAAWPKPSSSAPVLVTAVH
jgi:nucleotide-binding universal stress UspA family protein